MMMMKVIIVVLKHKYTASKSEGYNITINHHHIAKPTFVAIIMFMSLLSSTIMDNLGRRSLIYILLQLLPYIRSFVLLAHSQAIIIIISLNTIKSGASFSFSFSSSTSSSVIIKFLIVCEIL